MKVSQRMEYKYIISYKDYMKLQPVIAQQLIHDKHGEEDAYPVHSVYFDDITEHGAADKAFGNEWHKKYRIRYYHDNSKRKLELKEKQAEATKKYALPISNELYKALIDNDLNVLKHHFDSPLIRRFTIDTMRFHLTPRCNVVYKREAYRDQSDNLRITFDHSLKTNRFDTEFDDAFIDLMRGSDIIMEIKFERYFPKDIKALIKPLNLNYIATSKYFLAYQLLHP
jgi:hypothetical protein